VAKPQQLPSGKWRIQIRKNGIYRSKTFASKKAATDWEAELSRQVEEVESTGYVRPKHLTISNLIDLYMDSIKGKRSGRSKRFSIEKIRSLLGKVQVENLNPVQVRDFIDRRESEGAGGVTIAADLSYLAVLLKWAKQVRYIHCRPEIATEARGALEQRGLRTRSKERNRMPTQDELDLLYAYWRESKGQIPMGQIARFALASAMRQGEITSITAEMVDVEGRTVTMARKDPRRKEENIQTVPMPPVAMEIIREQMIMHSVGRLFPYNGRSVSARFTRTCKKLGIHDLRFHDLRHAATVSLFRAGLDIPRVAMITGHRDWKNLKRYADLQPSDVHSILDGAK
jgi:integrase